MNYPNKIKKNISKNISYGNRGMILEDMINDANKYYSENDIAYISKKPTPIGINKTLGSRIIDAYFKEKSTLDYVGLYKARYIEFDAKESKSKTSFNLNNISNHQINHLDNILKHNGISFLIIYMCNTYYLLSGKKFIDFIKSNDRKSIPLSYIVENSYEIKYNYNKGLDYINALNNLLEEKYEEN